MSIDKLIESVKDELEELFNGMPEQTLEASGIKKNSVAKVTLSAGDKESIDAESDPDKQRKLAMDLILKRLYWGCAAGSVLKPLKNMGSEDAFENGLNALGGEAKSPDVVLDMANRIRDEIGKNMTVEDMRSELIDTLVHFSAKITHSSANGGVRISDDRKAKMPYIFSATLQNEFGPLDFDRISPSANVMPNMAIKVMSNKPVQPQDIIDDLIVKAVPNLPTGPLIESVCPLLKQIIVPGREEGEHVVLSPMSATGIMRLIKENSTKEVEVKKGKKVKKVDVIAFNAKEVGMNVGGANSINVSAVSAKVLKNAFLFDTPERNYSMRRIYSLIMRGYSVLIDKGMADAIVNQNRHNAENSKDTISARNLEMRTTPIVRLVKKVCDRIKNDIDLVGQTRAITGEDKFSEKLKTLTEGNPLGRITGAIFEGKFNEDAIDAIKDAIFAQLSQAFRDAKAAYPDATASRHKEIVKEVLMRNLPCTK